MHFHCECGMPEIYINKRLIVDAPDESGLYQTEIGPILVDSKLIHPDNKTKLLLLEGVFFTYFALKGGQRVIEISNKRGTGSQPLNRRAELEVRLHGAIEPRDYRKGGNGRRIGAYFPDYPQYCWGWKSSLYDNPESKANE